MLSTSKYRQFEVRARRMRNDEIRRMIRAVASALASAARRLRKQPRRDATKLVRPLPALGEAVANTPQPGEDALPVRHVRERVLLQPLAIKKHALVVAARAEVASPAEEGERIICPHVSR
jgi:hypothetical protein